MKSNVRKPLIVVAILAVLAFAFVAGLAINAGSNSHEKTREIATARVQGLRASSRTAIEGCLRDNAQDAGMIFLLDTSVRASRRRGRVLTREDRAALKKLRALYAGADCKLLPVVVQARKEGAITKKEVKQLAHPRNTTQE